MIQFNNTKDLEYACKIIFGPLFNFTMDTMKYLEESGVKVAYRKKVKNCHPDKSKISGISEDELTMHFKQVNEAYNLILKFINNNKNNMKINETINNIKKNDFYYSGNFPKKKLRFGEYLFYKKIISWYCLIQALVWQYKNRPKIGELCKSHNIIDDNDIINTLKNIKPGEKFGNAALRHGFIKENILKEMLIKQSNLNMPLGKYFLLNNIFTKEVLKNHLNEHFLHNLTAK